MDIDLNDIADTISTLLAVVIGLFGGAYFQNRAEERQATRDHKNRMIVACESLIVSINQYLDDYLRANMRWQTAIDAKILDEINFADSPAVIGRVRRISSLAALQGIDIQSLAQKYEDEQEAALRELHEIAREAGQYQEAAIQRQLDVLARSARKFAESAEAAIVAAAKAVVHPSSKFG